MPAKRRPRPHAFHSMRMSVKGIYCLDCRRKLPWNTHFGTTKSEERDLARRVRLPGETLKAAAERWYRAGLPAARKLEKR